MNRFSGIGVVSVLLAGMMAGCVAQPNASVVQAINTGNYGIAREALQAQLPPTPAKGSGFDRDYLLARMRLGLIAMADGYTVEQDELIGQIYEVLTLQGLNADKTITSVVINEDLKTWKGEPFEQALLLHYVAIHWAQQGSWDNARAAIDRSIFHLRDYGVADTVELADKAANKDVASKGSGDQYLDSGYVARESDFAMGYLMKGIANQQIARESGDDARMKEALDNYRMAGQLNSSLDPLCQKLIKGEGYNTILIVDAGRGPQKIATGPDNAVSKFTPIDQPGQKITAGGESWPSACSVNQMAQDHRWNNLEDIRIAKSVIGDALIAAAAATAAMSSSRDSQYVALGLLAAGLISKAGAHADTRYCEAMPAEVFIVPVQASEGAPVELQLENGPKMVLTGLKPPAKGVQVRYVRFPAKGAPAWMNSGQVMFANEYQPAAEGRLNLPYLLGGHCVRPPTQDTLDSYQKSGFLQGMSLSELQELYRVEGLYTDPRDNNGVLGRHVLEGGQSLVAPMPGSTGYLRLFCQEHPPYRPRSEDFKRLAAPWMVTATTAAK